MKVIEIIAAHIRGIGADGLHNGDECGCGVDALAPCDQVGHDCVPAYHGVDRNGEDMFYIQRERAQATLRGDFEPDEALRAPQEQA